MTFFLIIPVLLVSHRTDRKFRLVEKGLYKFAVCERCNAQFKSSVLNREAAEQEIQQQFDAHNCKPVDTGQNALRIVRESTEGK
jgi:hypothetical protein